MAILAFAIMGMVLVCDFAIYVGIQLYFEGHPLFKD